MKSLKTLLNIILIICIIIILLYITAFFTTALIGFLCWDFEPINNLINSLVFLRFIIAISIFLGIILYYTKI